jgi:asparagine synthase (glutamine-hydrolysing)
VKRRTKGKKRVAVSFSGGLDSSLLAHCASKYADVILCTVFVKGSRDERSAEEAARALGLEMVGTQVREADLQRELWSLDLPFSPTQMDRALWTIYSISARVAKTNGAETILLGQLADELFGGYMKYERALTDRSAGQAQRMMAEDVAACGKVGLIRDEQACSRSIEPAFPFADESVVGLGLATPPELKIGDGERKTMLRDAARNLGLPEGIVETPKKAAQYSSGVYRLVAH